uniref:Uncharacterized protein n=1 Tax=Anopheles darlingi TaxID=43151 RepID=A0A2M4D8A6_ANODA
MLLQVHIVRLDRLQYLLAHDTLVATVFIVAKFVVAQLIWMVEHFVARPALEGRGVVFHMLSQGILRSALFATLLTVNDTRCTAS